ncbi:MAG: alpha-ketoglutarate-dependent dioxygenase AlkB [Saprospiraceae bacterium]|nr:alpha-ketoglutarate-dependent dioxygenase AlkB [Saprospiraceae bacterium]
MWLFNTNPQGRDIPLEDGELTFYDQFLNVEEAHNCFALLRKNLAWRQDSIKMYGKELLIPRLQAWYGDQSARYKYSGILLEPLAWTPTLLELKKRVEKACNTKFNSVLVNLYRDGKDSMGWHSDDEPELGENPVIASLSLGATRRFSFRHRQQKDLAKIRMDLLDGSLLIMRGKTQHYWQHSLPKTAKKVGERINLTFRSIRLRT